MRKSIIVFQLLIHLYAQSQDSPPANLLNIRIAPLALVDIYAGSCYKIGLEFSFMRNNSMMLEYGGYFPNFNGLRNLEGSLYNGEWRHYLLSKSVRNNGVYLAADVFYKEQRFEYQDAFVDIPDEKVTIYTEKYVACFNINLGMCAISEKRLLLDFFVGLGIRNKVIHCSYAIDDLEKMREFRDSQSLHLLMAPGKFTYPNLNLGFRLGYRILK